MHFDNSEVAQFLSLFRFRRRLSGYAGVERECFLVEDDVYVPRSADFLRVVADPRWTYELSACQAEVRTRPHRELGALHHDMLESGNSGLFAARKLNLRLLYRDVALGNMPLDVFPDPRYRHICQSIPKNRLRAACRVAGTHVHVGMQDIEHALRAYAVLREHVEFLSDLGDHCHGERLRTYKEMAVHWEPMAYENVEHFFEVARQNGFASNPRDCWQLIRISVHGTIELRMFGSIDSVDEILWWVQCVRSLLQKGGVYK